MATYMTLLVLIMALIVSSATATDTPSRNQDLAVAIEEMQKANYFAFVMLINMVPADLIPGNVTFLMPNDRTLSRTMMPENAVSDFLRRHSIPSPLLFDYLGHIPTGSIIPTMKPEFMLNVSNNGRKSFYLNNVRITSPNICTAGSAIICHGIDGVIQAAMTPEQNSTLPSPTCNNSSNCSSPDTASASPPSWPSPAPPFDGINLSPTALPPTNTSDSPKMSGSSQRLPHGGLLTFLTICVIYIY